MSVHNHKQERKNIYSIDFIEKLLDKNTYPISKNRSRKVIIDNEEIRYYNRIYRMFFEKGYRCVCCGVTGSFFAIERSGGEQNTYGLSLYALDDNENEVLMVAGRIDLTNPSARFSNIQPMCILCNLKHNNEPPKIVKSDTSVIGDTQINNEFAYMRVPKMEYPFLINGVPTRASKVIAYCNNATHWGWLNERLVKQHQCFEKQCPYMEKANPYYWSKIESQKRNSNEFRVKSKEKKQQDQERDEYIRSVFESYKDVYITSIKEDRKGLYITYIYDKRVDLSEAIQTLRQKYKCSIRLKSVVSNEENRKLLIRDREENA